MISAFQLKNSIVRIFLDGELKGAGFLVHDGHILTCAHVVKNNPKKIYLDFPGIDSNQGNIAHIIVIEPKYDIAVLKLNDLPPTNAQPIKLINATDVWDHDFGALGFPKGQEKGVWAEGKLRAEGREDGLVMLENPKVTGYPVMEGFSGTPVWDRNEKEVVGMIVEYESNDSTKVSFMNPTKRMTEAWPELEEITPEYWIKLGSYLSNVGNYSDSIKYFKKAIEIDPENLAVLENVGESHYKLGEFVESIKYYDIILAKHPRNVEILNKKGLAYAGLNNHEKAIYYYDRALRINLKNANILNNKGNSFYAINYYNHAESCYEKALTYDSENPITYRNLARLYATCYTPMTNFKQAITYYKKAHDIFSDIGQLKEASECNKNISDLRLELKMENLIKIVKDLIKKGDEANEGGRPIEAIKYYEEANLICDSLIYYNKSNTDALLSKAIICDKRNRPEANKYYKLAKLSDISRN